MRELSNVIISNKPKKIQKKFEKCVDKRDIKGYNNKAVRKKREVNSEKTLKKDKKAVDKAVGIW